MFSFPYAGPEAYHYRVDGFKWYIYFIDLVRKHNYDGCGPEQVKYIGQWFKDNAKTFSHDIGKDAALIDIPEVWNEDIHGLLRKKAACSDIDSRDELREIAELGNGFFLLISDGRLHEASNVIAINVVEDLEKSLSYSENEAVLDSLMQNIASAIRHDDITFLLETARAYKANHDGKLVELIEVGETAQASISNIFLLKPSMFGMGFDLKEAYRYFTGDSHKKRKP